MKHPLEKEEKGKKQTSCILALRQEHKNEQNRTEQKNKNKNKMLMKQEEKKGWEDEKNKR